MIKKISQRLQGAPRRLREINYSLHLLGTLREEGWHRSVASRAPVTRNGDPLPWFTYPAILWMDAHVENDDSVFEFGAGYSTLWFAKRVKSVVSVEHDPHWIEKLSSYISSNVELIVKHALRDEAGSLEGATSSDYARVISAYPDESFDIIVIDGMERVSCAATSAGKVKEDGIIVFDNSDRPWHRPALDHLRDLGFGRIDFHGFIPGYGYQACTSIFARGTNRWTLSARPPRYGGY